MHLMHYSCHNYIILKYSFHNIAKYRKISHICWHNYLFLNDISSHFLNFMIASNINIQIYKYTNVTI